MKVRYTLGEEDYAVFADWYYRNNSEVAKHWRIFNLQFALGLLILWLMISYYLPQSATVLLLAMATLCAVVLYVSPKEYLDRRKEDARKHYRARQRSGFFGSDGVHRNCVEISLDGMMSITEKSTLLENWDLIYRIELVGNHVFFVGKLGVTIIPRLAVTEGNFDEFVAEARRLHADATGTNTPVPLPAR